MKTRSMASVLVAAILLPCVRIYAQDATNRDGSPPEVRGSRSLEDWISLAKSGTSDLRLEAAKELGPASDSMRRRRCPSWWGCSTTASGQRHGGGIVFGQDRPGGQGRSSQTCQVDNRL